MLEVGLMQDVHGCAGLGLREGDSGSCDDDALTDCIGLQGRVLLNAVERAGIEAMRRQLLEGLAGDENKETSAGARTETIAAIAAAAGTGDYLAVLHQGDSRAWNCRAQGIGYGAVHERRMGMLSEERKPEQAGNSETAANGPPGRTHELSFVPPRNAVEKTSQRNRSPDLRGRKKAAFPGLTSQWLVALLTACPRDIYRTRQHAYSCGAVADFHRLPEHPIAFTSERSVSGSAKMRPCRDPPEHSFRSFVYSPLKSCCQKH